MYFRLTFFEKINDGTENKRRNYRKSCFLDRPSKNICDQISTKTIFSKSVTYELNTFLFQFFDFGLFIKKKK